MQVTGFNNEPVATNSDAHAHHGMQIKADGAIEPSLNDDCCAEGCNCVLMCSSYAVTSETLASVPLIFSDMATTLSVSATDLYLPKQKRPPKSLI